jgi:hypothetical protein
LVVLLLWAVLRRRGTRGGPTQSSKEAVTHDDSPSGKLLSLAEEVRGTLVKRFGPAMRARTTEELAADARVRETLGEHRLDPLIRLLAEADRWKFATRPENGQDQSLLAELPVWDACHQALLADTEASHRPHSNGDVKG